MAALVFGKAWDGRQITGSWLTLSREYTGGWKMRPLSSATIEWVDDNGLAGAVFQTLSEARKIIGDVHAQHAIPMELAITETSLIKYDDHWFHPAGYTVKYHPAKALTPAIYAIHSPTGMHSQNAPTLKVAARLIDQMAVTAQNI